MTAAATTRRAPASRTWTHYVNDQFFDRPDLDPNLERLAFRLERLARERPWCVSSNDELREQLGCSQNTLGGILNRGESLGWFRRVLVPGRHGRATGRLGFVLFVRPTDRPVATPETFDQVAEQIWAENRRGSARSRTLPFPPPGPQKLGASVPKNWGPSVPKNWGLTPYSKEKTVQKTTTIADAGSSSSPLDPGPDSERDSHPGVEVLGDTATPQAPAANASTQPIALSPAPVPEPAPAVPTVAAGVPAELAAAVAEAIPGASREWAQSLLRDCGGYGLDLALLVLSWVKLQRPTKPTRYARVALSSWLTRLQAGAMTLEDVRAEVQGRSGPRSSPRPFDPSACLARLESLGWTIVPQGTDRFIRVELPGQGAPLWSRLPSELRQEVESHKAELKAYVLSRASERGKTVALRA